MAYYRKRRKKGAFDELVGWVLYILVIVLITMFIVNYVGQRTKVSGDSMETTLHDGDNLIVDKLSYYFTDPKRYDIVVFPYKRQEGVFYIKRIIGMPGDRIQIIDGYVYIDGEKSDEDYGNQTMIHAGLAIDEITLGDNEYFVLGDNRNNSADSRDPSVGILTGDDFLGKAWIRVYPFNNMGVIIHE